MAPCKDSCKKSCTDRITEEERNVINNSFYELDFSQRRLWFDGNISIHDVSRHSQSSANYARKHTLQYSLPVGLEKIPVCKVMFLRNLGLKTDGRVTEYVKQKLKGGKGSSMYTDARGKHPPKNKREKLTIHDHINSFHPQVSHHKLAHSPFRKYLDSDLTITSMWDDYNSKHEKVSYQHYRRVFDSMNIGFGRPSQDDCDTCTRHHAHMESLKNEHDRSTCQTCQDAEQHVKKYTAARREYQQDANFNLAGQTIFAVDMQKIILLPKLTTKEHFFVSRLVVFNETFASLKGDADFVMLWHEGIAGRVAANVASSFIKCINTDASDYVTLWAENCAAQNKNWTLFTALSWCVNQEWGPEKVTLKFLESATPL